MSKIFVCFIGTDGSGKSTLTENLFQALKTKKFRVKKVYGRYEPLLTRYLMRIGKKLFLPKADMSSNYELYLEQKRLAFREMSILGRIFVGLVTVEFYFEVLFKISIPYSLGYSIVADRYVHDTIINDIAVDNNLSFQDVSILLKRFWRYIPMPQLTFLVQVPEEIALQRKKDIPSASYLKLRNQYYLHLARSENLLILDGTIDIKGLESEVRGIVNKIIHLD